MKSIMRKTLYLIGILAAMLATTRVQGQEEEGDKRPARAAFESQLLIDNQTVVIPTKNTLEWDIMHRFGTIDDNVEDLFGLYDASNIKLAFTYSLLERLNLGFGITKFSKYVDFNAKYLILQQTRDFSMPVSVAYYGNVGINNNDNDNFEKDLHRLSFFNQLLLSLIHI